MTLDEYIAQQQKRVDAALERWVPAESVDPPVIHRAMRYSLFAGGKRIRPLLAMASAEAVSDAPAGVESAACALECIHAYSLIHDDLPALDDDDLRRGRPTCHKVFGEAVAILAGDALLTLAFEWMAATPAPAERVAEATLLLARAAGCQGMVAGHGPWQAQDPGSKSGTSGSPGAFYRGEGPLILVHPAFWSRNMSKLLTLAGLLMLAAGRLSAADEDVPLAVTSTAYPTMIATPT